MLISVIITTFKRPILLRRALHSVLTQPLPAGVDLEVVVADDDPSGSGFEGLSEMSASERIPANVRYVRRPEETALNGVARSRNRAMNLVQGEWLLFLDDDDVLVSGGVQRLLNAAVAAQADFCAGAYVFMVEQPDGTFVSSTPVIRDWNGLANLEISNQFPIGSYIVKRSIIELPFNPFLETHEDWLFLLDNLQQARVATIPEVILEITRFVYQNHGHRNAYGGRAQMAKDHAIIYALHQDPAVAGERQAKLYEYGKPSIDDLVSPGGHDESSYPFVLSTLQGRFLICNPRETIQGSLLQYGQFERIIVLIAASFSRTRPGLVIDIGANIGTFTVPLATELPGREVVAIEAQQTVFMHLCANILVNKLSNVRPVNVAIGTAPDDSQKIKVPRFDIFNERYLGSVSLDGDVQDIRGCIEGVAEPSRWAQAYDLVSLVSLDDMFEGAAVSLIKIDVEGMELKVLQSAARLIVASGYPYLLFETWSLEAFKDHRERLLNYVSSLGYHTVILGDDCFAFHPTNIATDQVRQMLLELGIRVG